MSKLFNSIKNTIAIEGLTDNLDLDNDLDEEDDDMLENERLFLDDTAKDSTTLKDYAKKLDDVELTDEDIAEILSMNSDPDEEEDPDLGEDEDSIATESDGDISDILDDEIDPDDADPTDDFGSDDSDTEDVADAVGEYADMIAAELSEDDDDDFDDEDL